MSSSSVLSEVTAAFDETFPSKSAAQAGFGVYVHIPFCAKRCDYCAFATWTDKEHLAHEYIEACVTQYQREAPQQATSVFFGGGTPSLIDAELLSELLAAIERAPGAEVTIECNPETLSKEKLERYATAGINRLSFGVQSFVPHVLTSLGRQHSPEHVYDALAWAREVGFEQCNVDIIYGAHGESIEDWEATLDKTLELGVPHISAYALTIEQATPLALDPSRHPNDEDQAEKYALTTAKLADAGYVNYEISNWAKPDAACKHNLLYWAQGNYAAIGCAAHGHDNGIRYWNVQTPERFIERIGNGERAEAGREELLAAQRHFEANELALRTRWGVSAEFFVDDSAELIAPFVTLDDDGIVRLNDQGRFLANEIAMQLRDDVS